MHVLFCKRIFELARKVASSNRTESILITHNL